MVKIKGTKGRRLPSVEIFASVEADVPDLDGVAGGLARIYAEIDSAIARELAKTAEAPSVATILEEARRREVPPALLRRLCVKDYAESTNMHSWPRSATPDALDRCVEPPRQCQTLHNIRAVRITLGVPWPSRCVGTAPSEKR